MTTRLPWLWGALLPLLLFIGATLATLLPANVVRASSDAAPRLVKAPVSPASSWGRKFNPEGLVPENGFAAYYFDRTAQSPNAFEEHTDSIAVKYAWSDLHGIASEAFAAYWVGLVRSHRGGSQRIDLSLSWSRARVFVNGELVTETARNSSIDVALKPGANLVEVEYINNWHTTEFKLTLSERRLRVPRDGVAEALAGFGRRSGNVHYVGLYESDNRDTSVDVDIAAGARDVVLWLDSYEAIDWRIDPADSIAAIVIGSYSPGSRVVNAGDIPVIEVERGFRMYSIVPTGCHCAGSSFHCESEDSLASTAQDMREQSGFTLAGFAVQYSAARVVTAPYDNGTRTRIAAAVEAKERKKAECFARQNPDFDSMFGKDS